MIFVCKLLINKIKGYLFLILSLSGPSSGSTYRVCQIMVLIKTYRKQNALYSIYMGFIFPFSQLSGITSDWNIIFWIIGPHYLKFFPIFLLWVFNALSIVFLYIFSEIFIFSLFVIDFSRVPVKCETKRNRTKRKSNKTKWNRTKRNEADRNKTKQNATLFRFVSIGFVSLPLISFSFRSDSFRFYFVSHFTGILLTVHESPFSSICTCNLQYQ
jgi:hypothetical protein